MDKVDIGNIKNAYEYITNSQIYHDPGSYGLEIIGDLIEYCMLLEQRLQKLENEQKNSNHTSHQE